VPLVAKIPKKIRANSCN